MKMLTIIKGPLVVIVESCDFLIFQVYSAISRRLLTMCCDKSNYLLCYSCLLSRPQRCQCFCYQISGGLHKDRSRQRGGWITRADHFPFFSFALQKLTPTAPPLRDVIFSLLIIRSGIVTFSHYLHLLLLMETLPKYFFQRGKPVSRVKRTLG